MVTRRAGGAASGVRFSPPRLFNSYMKLISLNTWGGKLYPALIQFIKNNSKDTDVFCFQEVFNTPTQNFEHAGYRLNFYQEISRVLQNFEGYYASTQNHYVFLTGFVDFELSYGLAIFIKKNIKILEEGDFFVFRERNGADPQNLSYTLPRNVQYIKFVWKDTLMTVCNFHGIWFPGPKLDSPERLKQSEKIKNFLEKQEGEKILCGDFNLKLNTESLKILEGNMKNLVKDYKIPTTRSKLYDRVEDKFADYILVSPGIKVLDFQVPNIDLSDHLPMILEFSKDLE